jgi:predicted cation transporter
MKASYKPLSAFRITSLTISGVYFIAFLLFLLVGLSSTIIKSIFLFSIHSTAIEQQPSSIATQLRFGVWGVCVSG